MRNSLLAGFAVAAVAVLGMAPHAHAREYPFCMRGNHYLSPLGDCSFDTLQQCKATAFGLRAYCDVNPYYADAQAPIAYPRRPLRRY
jgi:hypothetical protein